MTCRPLLSFPQCGGHPSLPRIPRLSDSSSKRPSPVVLALLWSPQGFHKSHLHCDVFPLAQFAFFRWLSSRRAGAPAAPRSRDPGPRFPPGPGQRCPAPEASAPPLPRAAGLISAHRGLQGVAGAWREPAAWARGPGTRATRQAAGRSGCCGSCCCSA